MKKSYSAQEMVEICRDLGIPICERCQGNSRPRHVNYLARLGDTLFQMKIGFIHRTTAGNCSHMKQQGQNSVQCDALIELVPSAKIAVVIADPRRKEEDLERDFHFYANNEKLSCVLFFVRGNKLKQKLQNLAGTNDIFYFVDSRELFENPWVCVENVYNEEHGGFEQPLTDLFFSMSLTYDDFMFLLRSPTDESKDEKPNI